MVDLHKGPSLAAAAALSTAEKLLAWGQNNIQAVQVIKALKMHASINSDTFGASLDWLNVYKHAEHSRGNVYITN